MTLFDLGKEIKTLRKEKNWSQDDLEKYSGITRGVKKCKITLKIFFKSLVINHLLKNGDAHLKNYGILYKKRGV